MYRFLYYLLVLLAFAPLRAQTMGNYYNQAPTAVQNYQVQFRAVPRPAAFINDANAVEITINALSNQAAKSQIAIFSVFQAGPTVQQVNSGMNSRLDSVKEGLKKLGIPASDIHIDMVNFLPTYAFQGEKKIFSKKTLTEVPTGFNLQKNLHIRYRDAELLDQILTVVTEAEIYDIIKVDYSVDEPQRVYTELREKTFSYLDTLVAVYAQRGIALDTARMQVAENAWVVYPGNRYESYTAHSSQKLTAKQAEQAIVTKAEKPVLRFYNAIPTNDYDLVINPGLLEPAAQFSYSLKVRFTLPEPLPEPEPAVVTKTLKQYMYLTPEGRIIPLTLEEVPATSK
ncbi:MAG: SIMPL domain-containing protein [Bacteroidota bacterium]